MNHADELIGKLVLVHPQLSSDPAGRAGQVGIITGADLDNDNIYVGFGKNGQGLYGTDVLLMLKSAEAIKQNLQDPQLDRKLDDYKAIFQISLLQEIRSSTANTKTAMSLALKNPNIMHHSMTTLEQLLERNRGQFLGR